MILYPQGKAVAVGLGEMTGGASMCPQIHACTVFIFLTRLGLEMFTSLLKGFAH